MGLEGNSRRELVFIAQVIADEPFAVRADQIYAPGFSWASLVREVEWLLQFRRSFWINNRNLISVSGLGDDVRHERNTRKCSFIVVDVRFY